MEKKIFVGVDGCKAGWFAVALTDGNKWITQVFPDILSLWNFFWKKYPEGLQIFIDIPIGLRENTNLERLCDLQSRKLLGKP